MRKSAAVAVLLTLIMVLIDCSPAEGCRRRHRRVGRCQPVTCCVPVYYPPCPVPVPEPSPTHSLFCCINGLWTHRGDYYSYSQAQSACNYYCAPYGWRCQIVAFGTVVSGPCGYEGHPPGHHAHPPMPSTPAKPVGVPGT